MAFGSANAQVYISGETFYPTSVTNDGLVVGSQGQNTPFYIWNPFTNEFTYIGGMSAGNGVGGNPRFSADGKLIAGTMYSDSIALNTSWQKTEHSNWNYKFTSIKIVAGNTIYAVGTSINGDSAIAIHSYNNGLSWTRDDYVYDPDNCPNYKFTSGIYAFGMASTYAYYAGGNKGRMYCNRGNGYWSPVDFHPAGDSTAIDTYTALDFYKKPEWWKAHYGVVGFTTTDGGYGVWATTDSVTTFQAATGVAGKPVSIAHADSIFFMVTENGLIQKSADHGLTWTTVAQTDNGDPFFRIAFADGQKGIATTYNVIYITRDGGTTWTKTDILPSISPWASSIQWLDCQWTDSLVTVVGSAGQMYQSKDNGQTFNIVRVDMSNSTDFTAYLRNGDIENVMAGGVFYRKSNVSTGAGYVAGVYNVDNDTWTPYATSGYASDESYGSVYNISGDGSTLVGLAYNMYAPTTTIQGHAAVWTKDGYTDLGSKFANINRATRANAVSYDGSVVAGWQDNWGPWYAALWTRSEDGNYTESLILADSTKTEDDIDWNDQEDQVDNLLGYCQAITADGKLVGGRGYSLSAVPGAWVYNRETKELKTLTEEDGTVAGISNDGTRVVGWEGTGANAWLWQNGTRVSLQDYATNTLGYDFNGFVIMSVYSISPNGRYVTGYGMDGMTPKGYVIDLDATYNGIEKNNVQVKAAVYPNPVSDELHISLPYDAQQVPATISLFDYAGHTVKSMKATGVENTLNVSSLANGVYLLNVNSAQAKKTFKVVVRH